jgi:hypothetical protein
MLDPGGGAAPAGRLADRKQTLRTTGFKLTGQSLPRAVWMCNRASRLGRVKWLDRSIRRWPANRLVFSIASLLFFGEVTIGRSTVKGSSANSSPDRLPGLTFSLRLRWHPYLNQRAVHPSTAAWFGIGYYAGSGFLRHRIVFPIHDGEGQLVAYAGRSIDGSEPRYLFPPGFRKSQVVFNLHRAGGAAASRPAGCVIVEGFFDCLRLHQAGYRKVIALMGANLSEMQETLLLASFREVVLMLDGA